MNKEIYILGVGHSTPLTVELAEACGYTVAGLYHYAPGRAGEEVYGTKILGTHDDLLSQESLVGKKFALSMGDNSIRENLYNNISAMGGTFPTLVHPTCIVSRFSSIGSGSHLDAYCCVQANSKIGCNCMIRPYVLVGHNTSIGDHSFIAAHTSVGAYITIGKNVFMGLSSVLLSSKVQNIADRAIIGAGAVVNRDVEEGAVVVGNPAKRIK